MIREEEANNFLKTLSELYNRIESINCNFSEEHEKLIKKYFHSDNKFHNITGEGFFPTIERITINKRVIGKNTRIDEVDKLKYPPAQFVEKYGRANLKHQSVFYGTFNFMTAVMEMNPEKGDLITVSRWTLKNGTDTLTVCPMFLSQPEDGSLNINLLNLYSSFVQELKKFPPHVAKLYFELHRFYSKCFAREINSNNNHGYIFTAIMADRILNEYKNGVIDAILYPSTKEALRTENIVIKKNSFDNKYELSETFEKRLIDFSEDRDKYVFERLGESSKIERNRVYWK